MDEIETALAGTAAIRSQMAGSVEFRRYNGGAVPDAAAADLAGASL